MTSVCSTEGCDRETHAKGMCNLHYIHYRKSIAPDCSIEACAKPSRSRGMCLSHYEKALRAEAKEEIDYDDFWEFVKKQLRIGMPNAKRI
jgi:hypothetical protein